MLGETKSEFDLGHERCNCEPDEEGSEEAHPREVEGTHVRSLEGEHLDFGSLVILVGINSDMVSIVFLPFGGFSVGNRHGDCIAGVE